MKKLSMLFVAMTVMNMCQATRLAPVQRSNFLPYYDVDEDLFYRTPLHTLFNEIYEDQSDYPRALNFVPDFSDFYENSLW